MPIDFPTNPTSGQTYSYNSITWEYNGVAWDKQGGGGSVGPQGNTGATGPQGNTGATGPVGDYVISLRGLTGAVGLTNGTGINLSVSGQTMTFSNTGVLSIDGSTGSITNVARTNVDNIFSASQTISTSNAALSIVDSSSLNEVSFQGEFNRLYFYNDLFIGEVFFQPTIAAASTITVSLPDYTTILAGLAGTQTFTGINTFNALTNFPGGISAAGATFSSLARFTAGISAAGGTFGGNVQAATYTETLNSIRVTNNARSWFL
jgi:hypothetical protein